jgi:hypothetical protein
VRCSQDLYEYYRWENMFKLHICGSVTLFTNLFASSLHVALESIMLIPLPTGISLEADLEAPTTGSSQDSQGNKLAILLHPWSWLGGSMNDQCVAQAPIAFQLFFSYKVDPSRPRAHPSNMIHPPAWTFFSRSEYCTLSLYLSLDGIITS